MIRRLAAHGGVQEAAESSKTSLDAKLQAANTLYNVVKLVERIINWALTSTYLCMTHWLRAELGSPVLQRPDPVGVFLHTKSTTLAITGVTGKLPGRSQNTDWIMPL